MIFVEKALSMMEKGYAAIIIQNSAGSGKAAEYNKRILEHSTLLASIKMPIDLFIGKSSVLTNIYVFRVGEAHQKDDVVKFIDFLTMDIPAPIAKRQAKTYLIQIGQKNAIRKLLIWFVSGKRSSVFLQKKNTTRGILIQITEVTGIKLLRSTQNQLWMISKRQ